jgi:hypothetical protein
VSEGGVVVVVTDRVLVSVFVTTDVSVVICWTGAGIGRVTVTGASGGPVTVTMTGETIEVVAESEASLGVGAAPAPVRVDTISPATRRPAENPPRTLTATGPRFGIRPNMFSPPRARAQRLTR